MIKSIQTWGEDGYESLALSAFNALAGLPGFYICQDPGCFIQILPQEKDGITRLTWQFGIVGQRVVAMGDFEGCCLAYRVTHNGNRGGYSETVFADESTLCPTFGEAQQMAKRMSEENELPARSGRAHKYSEIGISPCLIIE